MADQTLAQAGALNVRPLTVSIIIDNYNYGRFLSDAIDSALNQSYANTEVIVVDDGSTDNSREIIACYGAHIIPVFKENGGQASAFNAGFAASRGEWIMLLDSDDLFSPGKAEEILKLAKLQPQAGFIAHNLEYCDISGAPTTFLPPTISTLEMVDDRRGITAGTSKVYPPATSGLCFRRDVLAKILPMPEGLRVTADNYLKAVALSLTPVLLVPATLAKQRIHSGNLYTLACRRDASQTEKLRRALIRAAVGFEIKNSHPQLKRLVWKQYGAIMGQLAFPRSGQASALRTEIRQKYSVTEWSPVCAFYVGRAFVRTLGGTILRKLRAARTPKPLQTAKGATLPTADLK